MKKSLIRKYIFFALLVVTPAGFLFKSYSGPVQWWFNAYGAGLLYEVFWILVGFLLWPRKALVTKIPLWVFIGTSLMEIFQLWHPWILEKIRSYFLGRALIGTSFTWWDFPPHYAMGCVPGWGLIEGIVRRTEKGTK